MNLAKAIIGIASLGVGILISFFEKTTTLGFMLVGFGLGMVTSSFQED
jgi:hypothetical protein